MRSERQHGFENKLIIGDRALDNGISNGLEYAHLMGICHPDFSLDNIYVSEGATGHHVKISSFKVEDYIFFLENKITRSIFGMGRDELAMLRFLENIQPTFWKDLFNTIGLITFG
uniref:Protein kinase domain-containing protein n=1 Tax=Ananas comosus var. bracteatus TaxID=296719 RepID=A0A6V7QHN4_ANACO|nr:unnamed protein product [Ananas comosus var. bracteatus]